MKKQLLMSLACLVSVSHAQELRDYSREVETSERETAHWVGQYNTNGRWPNGIYRWWFNPSHIPSNLNSAQVLAAMQTAAARWAGMCNIRFEYQGITAIEPETKNNFATDRVNVWGFANFIPELSGFSGWTPVAILLTQPVAEIIDADIKLNAAVKWDIETVEATFTHELGHAIGLGHSNVSESVMFANPYHSTTYIRTLRGDDAQGCAALYGASADALANRTMNWAETVYVDTLKSGPAPNAMFDGYFYRHYPISNNYIGVKYGDAYYLGPSGKIENLGPLSAFTTRVIAAGF
jgi:hypothetical protein